MIKISKKLLIALIIALGLFSCEKEHCYEITYSQTGEYGYIIYSETHYIWGTEKYVEYIVNQPLFSIFPIYRTYKKISKSQSDCIY